MRIRFDKARMVKAVILLCVAAAFFAASWLVWPAPSPATCIAPGRSDDAIRECVAQRARQHEPNAATYVLLTLGGATLAAALLSAARATYSVMSMTAAAGYLEVSFGELRRLIDSGTLEIRDQRDGSIFLDPEQVRRLASRKNTPAAVKV